MPDVTIKDVAQAAKVSVGTASMALNGKKSVNEQTRQQVLKVAKELGYQPNKYARFLTSKRTHTIGLIVTDITNPFFGLIISCVQQELENRGYDVMLGISGGSITKEQSIVSKFISLRVDGVLTVPSHKQTVNVTHFLDLQQQEIPLCFITSYYSGIQAPCVMTDLSAGSYQLTKHLLEHGHSKIAYIVANLSLPLSRLRVDGYQSAFLEARLPLDPAWVVVDAATFEGGYHAVGEILKTERPDAILAMNDIMALGALKRLKEEGLRVPEDISLAGYDDLIYTTLLETPLTTVRQPVEQMCLRAVETLLGQIENPGAPAEKIFLQPQLVVRQSTRNGTVE